MDGKRGTRSDVIEGGIRREGRRDGRRTWTRGRAESDGRAREARDSRVEPAMDARGRRRRVGPRRRRRLLKGRRGGRSTVGGWLAARREGEARRRIGGGERTPPRGWRTQLSSMSANARVLKTTTRARVSRGSGGLRAGACALKRRRAEREKFHISQQPPKVFESRMCDFRVRIRFSYLYQLVVRFIREHLARSACIGGGGARRRKIARPRCAPPFPSHPTSPRAL